MKDLKVLLGYKDGSGFIQSLQSIFVCGLVGSGKTEYLKNIVASLRFLNNPESMFIRWYSRFGSPRVEGSTFKLTICDTSDVKSSGDIEEYNNNVLKALKNNLEMRMDEARNGKAAGEFHPLVFVFDDVLIDMQDYDDINKILLQAITYGSVLNIHVILAVQSCSSIGIKHVNAFHTRVALRCDGQSSKMVVGTPIASSVRFNEGREIVLRYVNDFDKVTILDNYPLLSDTIKDLNIFSE